MRIHFVKMSGAGNDMVLVDHRDRFAAGRERELAARACDRRTGIGADGLILLEPDEESDFFVRFFNPDGSEYDLCGNGARCVPFFAEEIGRPGPTHRFRTGSGLHTASVTGPGTARVTLAAVREVRLDVPVDLDGHPASMDWGDIGVPHGLFWVDDPDGAPFERWASHLRSHPAFGPEGTNVSLAALTGPDRLRIRTFERGVEGETLACGSGSAVVATLARRRGRVGDRVELEVRSGDRLVIHLPVQDGERGPDLEGPVTRCFEGVLDISAP